MTLLLVHLSAKLRVVLIAGITVLGATRVSAETLKATYLYVLGDETGALPLPWVPLSWDERHSELYLVDGDAGLVRVFNDAGMSVFSFGDDGKLGRPYAAVALDSGDLVTLNTTGTDWTLAKYSYRGEPRSAIAITGAPPEALSDFRPQAMKYALGKLYLVDKSHFRVLVVEPTGALVTWYDLRQQLSDGSTDPGEMRGFSVDTRGNMLMTVPTAFRAFIVAPDGGVRTFGVRGSTPGKFNLVSGIAADEDGRIYVADMLRSVISVFDPDLQFIGEFGHRGADVSGLRVPYDIVVANNRVYVTQSLGGVKTYGVRFE